VIKLTMDRTDIKGMIERGTILHGHAGPYLNLGIRMGVLALNILNVKGYFDLSVEVELKNHRPVSCLIDGLQISTGCTLGKGNIKIKDNPNITRAIYKSDKIKLIICLKPEITKLLDFETYSCEDLGKKILDIPDEQLFDYYTEDTD